jgi:hypothetical protein
MSMLSTVPATAGTDRIAGIDVGQLLRDLGEASANDSSTALFCLLLSAQRVLMASSANATGTRSPDEATVLASFNGMDDDGRNRLASFSRQMQKRFPRQRANLTLVLTSRQGGAR